MGFVRNNYYVLEAISFALWGVFLSLSSWFIQAGPEVTFADFATGMMCLVLFIWLFWRFIGTILRRGGYWPGLILLTLGTVVLAMLLLDLNARFIVSRWYSGKRPIPYVIPGLFTKTSSTSPDQDDQIHTSVPSAKQDEILIGTHLLSSKDQNWVCEYCGHVRSKVSDYLGLVCKKAE